MYFNFDDRQPDFERIDGAISWREGLLLSLVVHLLGILAVVMLPDLLPGLVAALSPDTTALEERMAAMREQESNDRRFVFVQPRAEFEAQQPPRNPELSDRDRSIMTPYERTPEPANPLPYSRGNTTERVDQPGTPEPPKPADRPGESGSGATEPGSPAPGPPVSEERQIDDPVLRGLRGPKPQARSGNNGTGTGGGLANALRDVGRYVPEQIFDNPQGGGQFGEAIQFDTKGVEFGPWVRRFLAQVRRNWFIPYAAMSLRGHVSVSFNVHKNGAISDIAVVATTGIEAFNNSSFNAIAASNPTLALPPEYPADRAFITITFYYNETPPSR
jgi:outer membrane biosynthesis protein TonB